MVKYIIRRLLQSIPTFFGITLFSYLLIWLAPGDPVSRMFFAPNIRPADKERLALELGINDPFHVQYLRWLVGDDWMRRDTDGDGIADTSIMIALDVNGDGEPEPPGERKGILRGDFGNSFATRGKAAVDVIIERIPATLELGVTALIFSILIGIPIGVFAAVYRGGIFDNLTRILAVIFNAVPIFWMGLILILIFGSWLGWLPLGSRCAATLTGGCAPMTERLNYLLLPMLVLSFGNLALFSRFMRTSMLDVMNQDYVRTARAKGLANRVVYFKHGMRNAMIPIITLLGPALTGLWAGAVVTETIFAWPGVGRSAVQAVVNQDDPVVMAVVIFSALSTIIGFLISDILYAVVDPRIRY